MTKKRFAINCWQEYFVAKKELPRRLAKNDIIDTHNTNPFRFNIASDFLQVPTIYCDLRDVQSLPEIEEIITAIIAWDFENIVDPPSLFSPVPDEATGLTAIVSSHLGIPRIFPRKSLKDHGQIHPGNVYGRYEAGQKVYVIEGTITQGGNTLATCRQLESVGLRISRIFSVISYNCGATNTLTKYKNLWQSFLDVKDDILPVLLEEGIISEDRFKEEQSFFTRLQSFFAAGVITPEAAALYNLLDPNYQGPNVLGY